MNKDFSRIFKNFTGLSVVQSLSLILPFIYIPYATRIIGVENFGVVEYCVNYVVYFTCIINYGFYYSATKRVSINREDKEKLGEIISDVILTKFSLFIILSILYVILLFSVDFFKNEIRAFSFAYLALVNAVIIPWFFFQGREEFKTIALIMFVVKIISIIYVFNFINEKEDYPFLVAVNTLPESLLGILSFFIIKIKYKIKVKINLRSVKLKNILIKNFYVFANDFVALLYVNSIVFIAGLQLTKSALGSYTAAYKIVLIIQTLLLSAFVKAAFPFFTKLYKDNELEFFKKHKKLASYFLSGLIVISLTTFFLSRLIIKIIFGAEYYEAIPILRIFSLLPFFIGFGLYYGWVGLVVIDKQKILFKIGLVYGFLVITTLILFKNNINLLGLTFMRIFVEILLSTTIYIFFKHQKRKNLTNIEK